MTFEWAAMGDALLYILRVVPRTLLMAAFVLGVGIAMGAVVAVLRIGRHRFLNPILAVWISFTRAVPAIVQIFIANYTIPYLLAPIFSQISGETVKPFDVSPYWVGCLLFFFYHAAYQAENIRGALLSVPKGQYEAAVAIGMTPKDAYLRIAFPQALVVALPTFFTYYLHAVKALSLLFTIKVVDIFAAADLYAALYSRRTEPYVADAIIYWVLTILLTLVYNRWEASYRKKYQYVK